MTRRYTKAEAVEAFWKRVQPANADGCREWQEQSRHPKGYGLLRFLGKSTRAHCVVWELAHGPVPPGKMVCHTCDNAPCCELTHLYLGDNGTNMRDRSDRGRCVAKEKTRCPSGHPYDEENTYVSKRGDRMCRECGRIRHREWLRKRAS